MGRLGGRIDTVAEPLASPAIHHQGQQFIQESSSSQRPPALGAVGIEHDRSISRSRRARMGGEVQVTIS